MLQNRAICRRIKSGTRTREYWADLVACLQQNGNMSARLWLRDRRAGCDKVSRCGNYIAKPRFPVLLSLLMNTYVRNRSSDVARGFRANVALRAIRRSSRPGRADSMRAEVNAFSYHVVAIIQSRTNRVSEKIWLLRA
jgi:hypothetical protein